MTTSPVRAYPPMMTAVGDGAGSPVGNGRPAEGTSAGVHSAAGGQAAAQHPARKTTTPTQWRWRIVVGAVVILFGWYIFELVTSSAVLVNFLEGLGGTLLAGVPAIVILALGRPDHIAIARDAERVYRKGLSEDPGNKTLTRGLARSLRMQSDQVQARRRTVFALPVMAVIFGTVFLAGFAGYEGGYAAAVWTLAAVPLVIGAIRTAIRILPARHLSAELRDALRADLWHLTVGWLRIAVIVTVPLAIVTIVAVRGHGPAVWIPLLALAGAIAAAAHLLQCWVKAESREYIPAEQASRRAHWMKNTGLPVFGVLRRAGIV